VKFPDDIPEFLKRKFKNKHKEWLKTYVSGSESADEWPLEINLDIPTEKDALKQPEVVRSWISAWKSWQGSNQRYAGTLIRSERRWRSLGTQSVPEKLILENPDDIAIWIGEAARWQRAVERYKLFIRRWPMLLDILPKHFNVLADYNDTDFLNLSEVLSWLCANQNSNFYIRQIPIAGIGSKWLELRKGLVAELIAAIHGEPSDAERFTADEHCGRDFYKLCGLRQQPQLIRMRILDPELRKKFGGFGDITAPVEEIACIDITPAAPRPADAKITTFIIENIQTGLAFNDLKNSVVIMGLGYGVDVLGRIPWLQNTRCIYWGDIDTHGFAILNRVRSYLPNLETVLMDEAILLSHRELWVEEKDQHSSAELQNLTITELTLYQSLKNNVWGQHVRLEQERICWNNAWNILEHLNI